LKVANIRERELAVNWSSLSGSRLPPNSPKLFARMQIFFPKMAQWLVAAKSSDPFQIRNYASQKCI
jgi:hypothetical protein